MPLYAFEGLTPNVHADAFVAPTATLVGDVYVEAGASIWYGAVIRADYAPVIITPGPTCRRTQRFHGPPGLTTDIGPSDGCPQLRRARRCWKRVSRRERFGRARRRDDRRHAHRQGSVVAAGATIPRGCSRPARPRSSSVRCPAPAEFWVNANPSAYAEFRARAQIGIQYVGTELGPVWGEWNRAPHPISAPSTAPALAAFAWRNRDELFEWANFGLRGAVRAHGGSDLEDVKTEGRLRRARDGPAHPAPTGCTSRCSTASLLHGVCPRTCSTSPHITGRSHRCPYGRQPAHRGRRGGRGNRETSAPR
jgi:hypothetical protein